MLKILKQLHFSFHQMNHSYIFNMFFTYKFDKLFIMISKYKYNLRIYKRISKSLNAEVSHHLSVFML